MNRTNYSREQLLVMFPDVNSLDEVMVKLEQVVLQRGEVICQFVVNNLPLTELDETKMKSTHIDEIEQVLVVSENPQNLLVQVVENWRQEIPQILDETDRLAQVFRFQGAEGNYGQFVKLVDSCQFLIESLLSLETILNIPILVDQTEWTRAENLMTDSVAQALTAFELKNFQLLADIMEYDLANSIQSWLNLFDRISEKMRDKNVSTESFARKTNPNL